MIIYGWKDTFLKSKECKNIACENCNSKNTIRISVFSPYVHLFWIPTFNIGKKGIATCQSCHQEIKSRKMPDALKLEYQNLSAETKTPLWQFSGLLIILLFIIWIKTL